MAKLGKYSKLKPKVNVLTFIIIGVVFILLTTAIVLSIDTKTQKFEKAFNLDKNHVFELSTLKKVDKEIDKANEVMVLFNIEEELAEEQQASTLYPSLMRQLISLTSDNENSVYNNISEEDLSKFSKIYVVTISTKEKDREAFNEFTEKHELKVTAPKAMLVYFNETALLNEFDNKEKYEGELEAQDAETAILIRNLKKFVEQL